MKLYADSELMVMFNRKSKTEKFDILIIAIDVALTGHISSRQSCIYYAMGYVLHSVNGIDNLYSKIDRKQLLKETLQK